MAMRVSLCHATNSTTKQNQPEVTFTHSLVNDKYNTVYTYSGKNQKDLGQFFGLPLSREVGKASESCRVCGLTSPCRMMGCLVAALESWQSVCVSNQVGLGGGAGMFRLGGRNTQQLFTQSPLVPAPYRS